MSSYIFQYVSPAPTPYEVVVVHENDVVTLTCTCDAGLQGDLCKHRLNLLAGSREGILSDNAAEAKRIPTLVEQSNLAGLLREWQDAQKQAALAEQRANEIKKRIAALLGTPEIRH